MGLINARLNRVLLIAQASLSEHQYEAYRKLILDEFGRSGLTRNWRSFSGQRARTGKVRAGRPMQRKAVYHDCQTKTVNYK